MTDWWANQSTVKAAQAGLDQEMPTGFHFSHLKTAVEKGDMPITRLNDMLHRILRTEFAFGVFDNPPIPRPVNPFTGAEVAQCVAERGIVLLRNTGGQLPLKSTSLRSIAVIGSHSDVGVLSGWGSNQVAAAGGNPVPGAGRMVWHPSSPLKAIRALAPRAKVEFDPGTDLATAKTLAAASEVAIVFVSQHTNEGGDVPNLSLPGNQDSLIDQVAAANQHTIVVLETGGPVTMPWLNKVSAVLEAWYPGIRGGEAIARILFGDVTPSAKLPVTFPKSETDLSHVTVQAPPPEAPAPLAGTESGQNRPHPFDIHYSEGLKIGYKWFDAENKEPLFPFGHGLSYTTYSYSGLRTVQGKDLNVTFEVTNTGQLAGTEIAQVYASLPPNAGEPPKRLVAWEKVPLVPGETKTVILKLEPLSLSIFNLDKGGWDILAGEYKLSVGGSSRNTPLTASVRLPSNR